MNNKLMPIVVLAALMGSACAIPKVMVAEHYVGDTAKVAKHSLRYTGTVSKSDSSATDTMNYYIQVCDVADDKTTNCETSLVLENVLQYRVLP